MKRLIAIVLLSAMLTLALTSCDLLPEDIEKILGFLNDGADATEESLVGTENSLPSDDASGDEPNYLYTAFTPSEKQQFIDFCGEPIPFIANNEYYVKSTVKNGETTLRFYTVGNAQSEFEAYREKMEEHFLYELVNTYEDEYGDTWYTYEKGTFAIDVTFYTHDGDTYVDAYIYLSIDNGGNEGGGNGGGDISGAYIYTDFTADEKQMFIDYCGEVIPFIPNNKYSAYIDDEYGDLVFYTDGNTEAEFEEYRKQFSDYTYEGSTVDKYGNIWYTYSKDTYTVDMVYYLDGIYCLDVNVYLNSDGGSGDDGNEGGDSGNDGGSGSLPEDVDLITNDGKGLPVGTNGVYDVNFKDSDKVKDVTDQGYYLNGCPTVGSPGVLVIPIQFSDAPANDRFDLNVLNDAFMKGGNTDYYSVYDYYFTSSYGQLTLDIEVLDSWYLAKNKSTYYADQTMSYYGQEVVIGDQALMDEVLAYLEDIMDLSKFDSDGNGTIDAIVLITTLDIGDDDFHWAYRYWNIYSESEYDGVYANDYLWASYKFLNEGVDADGSWSYDDINAVNTYTYIHEFGHILGADDYYDTSTSGAQAGPMDGYDIMDSTVGDHNAYTKFNYGWVTSSRLVTTNSSVTLKIEDFSKNGDTVILANNWDSALGAYQEYFIIVYYKGTGLNGGDYGYFNDDGIIVYHVNASLYKETQENTVYYDVYYNNTDPSDSYGTNENLIEYVKNGNGYVYGVGDRLSTVKDDSGNALKYTFTVDALTDSEATVTFTKAA